ncbi:MAG: hypothetical protein ABI193_12740 [Minicystis sp.]
MTKVTAEEDWSPAFEQPFTIVSAKSLNCENGGKIITLMGNSIEPVAIEFAAAEPSFSIGLDVQQVSLDLAEHVGNGFQRMHYTITTTFTRPGLPSVTFRMENALFEKGFGFKSDAGGAPSDELSGKHRKTIIVYKGRELDAFALPGGALNIG